ncbi:MAG: TlpA family protein disulfide reductase [Actinomycetota bacterium]
MAEEYEGEVVFVGVSNNDTVPDGKAYVEQFDVPYAMAHAPEVWEEFEVPYQPVTIVLDDEGKITARVDGPVGYEQLKRLVRQVV